MYLREESHKQVVSAYGDVSTLDKALIARTRANYFTSDHGHSIGDRDYLGKRGYPSAPEVFDIPLMIRFPKAEQAGTTSDRFVQHHDIRAAILEAANVKPPTGIDGMSFLGDALTGQPSPRDHVTIGWGSATTVVTDRRWFNCKVDGTGVLLYTT